MSKVMIFGGTTEGRQLSEELCRNRIPHILSVATDYGEQVLGQGLTPEEQSYATVLCGRMDLEDIASYLKKEGVDLVIDATHPYAKIAHENIRLAAGNTGTEHLRLKRYVGLAEFEKTLADCRQVMHFPDADSCAEYLAKQEGNVLLTTGSKDLDSFCKREALRRRIFARVLPGLDSLRICLDQRLSGKQILAMQGPFSMEMNLAMLHQFEIDWMVTKVSGRNGGLAEKLAAAAEAGINICLIHNGEDAEEGLTMEQIRRRILPQERTVTLIGCGMGQRSSLTLEATEAIGEADLIFGAKRLLYNLAPKGTSYPYYLAKDILPVLDSSDWQKAVVLFSGDLSFCSGAGKMLEALKEHCGTQTHTQIRLLPGISSISNLAALTGISWDHARIMSIHGNQEREKWEALVLDAVLHNEKTFLLVSGVRHLNQIGELLQQYCREQEIRIYAGYQMGTDDEILLTLTKEEMTQLSEEGLYTLCFLNPAWQPAKLTYGVCDETFIRGKVPMTKEEVRTVSISRLGLREGDIVYDVGSGTGSVAMEIAGLSPTVSVYAIERKPEALQLIEDNRRALGLPNVHLIAGEAPEALEGLPAPTHAFFGGTGGRMKEILDVLLARSPKLHVVANAVSFETLQELLALEADSRITNFRITSLSAVRTRQLGNYHMMQGENPVWICSFTGKGADDGN